MRARERAHQVAVRLLLLVLVTARRDPVRSPRVSTPVLVLEHERSPAPAPRRAPARPRSKRPRTPRSGPMRPRRSGPPPCAAGTVPDERSQPRLLHQPVADVDPDIAKVLDDEAARQETTLEMIASENFVPQAILDCQGSVLTNKYAEGYPGKRYYGGCEHVDVAEKLAIDRAKELFGAEHVNVQPHAGAQANAAAYHALLDPGDRILGMKLDHGGHLTPRDEDQLLRQALRHRRLRRARGGLAPRHGRAPAARRGVQAQADPGRLVGLPAPARLRSASARSPTRSARC